LGERSSGRANYPTAGTIPSMEGIDLVEAAARLWHRLAILGVAALIAPVAAAHGLVRDASESLHAAQQGSPREDAC
jgi:hypothetical protein